MAELYVVLSQRESSRLAPSGGLEKVTIVTAETKRTGIIFTDEFPPRQYNLKYVDEVLTAHAQQIDDVHGL